MQITKITCFCKFSYYVKTLFTLFARIPMRQSRYLPAYLPLFALFAQVLTQRSDAKWLIWK